MADQKSGIVTFGADCWRYARQRSDQPVIRAAEQFKNNIWIPTILVAVGIALWGSAFFQDQFQGYMVALVYFGGLLMIAILTWPILMTINLCRAPSALWQRDQRRILDLQNALFPAVCLSFDQTECVRTIPVETSTRMQAGNRWIDVDSGKKHILVKCSNASSANVSGVRIFVTNIFRDGISSPIFFEPVRLMSANRQSAANGFADLGGGLPTYFRVLIQESRFDRPYLDIDDIQLGYNLLFDEPGLYQIDLLCQSNESAECRISLEIALRRQDLLKPTPAMRHEYEISWAREKTRINGS